MAWCLITQRDKFTSSFSGGVQIPTKMSLEESRGKSREAIVADFKLGPDMSVNIIRTFKLRMVRWVDHVACMGDVLD
jgi:hypothetical protein